MSIGNTRAASGPDGFAGKDRHDPDSGDNSAMNSIRFAAFIVVGLWAFLIAPATADVVVLSDGSRLLGTVERMGDGNR
jgi:hypothetical protein